MRNPHNVREVIKRSYSNYEYLNRFAESSQRYSITESFINLVILKNQVVKNKEIQLREGREREEGDERIGKLRDERLETYESMHEEKELIKVEKLFDKQNGKDIKKLAIYGRAGTGKTTSCQYIGVKWANGELWNDKFKAVILLPLRKISATINTQYHTQPSISEIIWDKGNCTLSSYNSGISVRHEEGFFKWLEAYRADEVSKLTQKFTSVSPSLSNRNDGIRRAAGGGWLERIFPASRTVQPSLTHTELMNKFAKELRVDFKEVYTGIAVEQALVGMAGINTIQTGVRYRTDERIEPMATKFSLRSSTSAEFRQFIKYYNQRFLGLIVQEEIRYQAGELTDIRMYTKKLYEEVVGRLGEYRRSNTPNFQSSRHII